jgi:TatD DNase family protein
VTAAERPEAPPPLAVPVADSHCHLDMALGHGEPVPVDQALAEAAAVGVTTIVQIGCDLPGARWAAEVASSYDDIWAGVALHPNAAPRRAARGELAAAYDEIDRLAALPQVRVVGETGLDYFRTGPEGREVQHESFRRHIDMAKRHGKALAIHDRDAHDDVLRILAAEGPPERVVFHCYSGDAAMARICAERGYYLSYAGTVTFANAPNLREALQVTPRDRVLVETDAPFLAPAPFRGRPNASYLIPVTLRAMAAVLDADLAELCADVMANTRRAFALP